MKVLASTPMYPPFSRVGAWLATHACLAHLVTLGHRVDVVPYLQPGWAYDVDGVHVHPQANLEDFTAEVVISHLGDEAAGARHAATIGAPSVRMIHGGHPDNSTRLAVVPCELAVFNSVSLAATIDHTGPGIVVRPPFEPAAVRTVPGHKVTLVNMTEGKGGILFWRLAAAMPDVQFLGVRGGYGMQVSNKRKNVTVIDPTTDMAGDVYSKTRLLLMPSAQETWGMVGLEAMCSGIPVIAHPTPGLRESLGDAGVFIDRDDLDGWVTAIRRLLHPTTWAEASATARAHADRYDPAPDLFRFAQAIEEVAA